MSVTEYSKNGVVSEPTLHRWIRTSTKRKPPTKRQYSAQERKEAVEQDLKSGMAQGAFAKTWGIHAKILSKWHVTYKEKGPQALVDGIPYGEGKKCGRKGVKQQVKDKIVETKKVYQSTD